MPSTTWQGAGWRNVHNWFTNPALIVPSVLFPMFFFTAFAGGLSRVDSIPGFDYPANYTTWIYGFVLLQASTFGGIFTGCPFSSTLYWRPEAVSTTALSLALLAARKLAPDAW